jgi:hypothetical protein
LIICAASGLYYLSELVEEHTVLAKKLLTRLIYSVIAWQTLLCVIDRLPLWLSLLSIASHVVYMQNLRMFPIVRLSDPIFILSCSMWWPFQKAIPANHCLVLVVTNHYFWFVHFSNPPPVNPYKDPIALPTFTEIASFFFLQVWLVPFSLFVSLSASENVLPSMGSEYATDPTSPLVSPARSSSALGLGSMGSMLSPRSASARGDGPRSPSAVRDGSLGFEGRGRKRGGAKGLVRVAVDGVREWVGETGEAMGLWKGERTRRW